MALSSQIVGIIFVILTAAPALVISQGAAENIPGDGQAGWQSGEVVQQSGLQLLESKIVKGERLTEGVCLTPIHMIPVHAAGRVVSSRLLTVFTRY